MRTVGGVLTVACLVLPPVSGCAPAGTPVADPPTPPSRVARDPAPPGSSLRLCLDPSASTDGRFVVSVRDELAAAVGRRIPPRPASTKGGVAGVAGLDVTVRLVSTRPLAYGEPYVDVRVPPLDALPPRPDMTRPGALDPGGPYLAWKALERGWAADYERALTAQAAAADQLAHLDVSRAQRSAVRDCVATLTTVPPAYPNKVTVVASDLEDNADTGAVPDLRGDAVVIIQPCPDGDAAGCAARFDDFRGWARAHGARSVDPARPEAAGAALARLVSLDH